MNSLQRQIATIRHEIPDRISVDAIAIENQVEIARFLDIEASTVYNRLGIDGRIISAPYIGELLEPVDGVSFTEWGTPNTGDYGTGRTNPLANATSIAEIEKYPWPDVAQYDFVKASDVAKSLASEYAVRGPYWRPLFCRVCDLFGMEEAMVRMSLEPRLFEAALERVFIITLEFCERLLEACGDAMPILCLGDDFATQRGMMISPEHWRRFLKPRYAKLFDIGKRASKFVWFHSCGDITEVIPDLIDIGMDVWETVQLHTLPMSAEQLKREYGKYLTFFGAINTQRLPFATLQEIRTEVERCINILGKGGGYICGPDHHVKPDVPAENAIALFESAKEFRREGYTMNTVSRRCS
jgi:uroporphyrinogen decarboxylase